MLKVLFETSVLSSGHSSRGIGTYARLLLEELEKIEDIQIIKSSTLTGEEKISYDIVHYPFFDFFKTTLPFNPLTKKIVTIHDVIPLIFPDFYKPGIKGKLRFKKQKLALKTVSAVITDSQASKNDIVKYLGVSPTKIHVVQLAASSDLEAQDEKTIRKVKKKYALPKKYILYVGDINYNKNIPQLIKALKYLPEDIKLVCVGRNFVPQDIPEWKWIETQVALSEVFDRVTFVNTVLTQDMHDLAAIYSGASVYVQPSLYEGFGLPVLEAMRCKTPVVSTQNSSLIEVGGEFAVFTQETAEEMAQTIQSVLDWSKTKRINWTRSAYKWASTFSWAKTAQETVAVYKHVTK